MNPTASRIAIASSVGTVSAGQLVALLGHATDVVVAATMLLGAVLSLATIFGEVVAVKRKRRRAREQTCAAAADVHGGES